MLPPLKYSFMITLTPFKIVEYTKKDGVNPFREWLETLQVDTRARIQARLYRLQLGNLGDHKSVGHGVLELRLRFGSGYRVYFALEGRGLVLLLTGGDKRTQKKDIIRARQNLIDYRGRK